MKKTLIAFALTTAAVWAAPEGNVYHTIADPTWHVTKIGSRWVIEDSKGFFVGYYVPQATPPVAAPAPSSAPTSTASAPTVPPASNNGSGPDQGSYNGGYGNYNGYGYGYNGNRNNGFYGNNYYNNGGYYYNNDAHCQPQFNPQPPPPQRDMGDVPGTPWKVGAP